MPKSPVKVVEEKFDSLEDFISEKVDEAVLRISKSAERKFEDILTAIRKNTEGNLGRALSDNSKKTQSKAGKCSSCNKIFKYLGSVEKHHLKDGKCPKTDKKARAINA